MVHVFFVILTPYFEAPQSFLSFMDHCPDIQLECAINPLPPCDHFTRALRWYLAVTVELPTEKSRQKRGGEVRGGGKHKSDLYKQVWWMLVPKVLCLLSNSYISRDGCVAGMMNHKTAPWWKGSYRKYSSRTVAWIHHRAWQYRAKNNRVCIGLNEPAWRGVHCPWLGKPDQSNQIKLKAVS